MYGFISFLGLCIIATIIEATKMGDKPPKEDIGYDWNNARVDAKYHFKRNKGSYLTVPNSWDLQDYSGNIIDHSQTSRTYLVQLIGTAKNAFGVDIPTRSPVYHYKVEKLSNGKWGNPKLELHNYTLK